MRHESEIRVRWRAWEVWKRIAKGIGDFQARVILFLFYFVILGPFVLVVRWMTDPLTIKPGTPRGWVSRNNRECPEAERATRQS